MFKSTRGGGLNIRGRAIIASDNPGPDLPPYLDVTLKPYQDMAASLLALDVAPMLQVQGCGVSCCLMTVASRALEV